MKKETESRLFDLFEGLTKNLVEKMTDPATTERLGKEIEDIRNSDPAINPSMLDSLTIEQLELKKLKYLKDNRKYQKVVEREGIGDFLLNYATDKVDTNNAVLKMIEVRIRQLNQNPPKKEIEIGIPQQLTAIRKEIRAIKKDEREELADLLGNRAYKNLSEGEKDEYDEIQNEYEIEVHQLKLRADQLRKQL